MSAEDRTFLGFDLSTQQLKAVIVDNDLQMIHEVAVTFDVDLPEFRTQGGATIDKKLSHQVTAPTLMWVKAVDMLMDRLTLLEVDFSRIAAISGTAQQHGSVYWAKNASKTLQTLNPGEFLHVELSKSFSLYNSPIWMDSSTTIQCKRLEACAGGNLKLAEITGSRAYERFTGSQIAKIYQTKPSVYSGTERISLVSSFLCSLFLGNYAPIDYSDASGMNLLDIHEKQWNQALLDTCAPHLREKLGNAVPSNTVLGDISDYFVERYGFNPNCKVVAFTGDNPASLVGLNLTSDWLAVSLGTSDCVIMWLERSKVILNGHIFCNPINSKAYMGLLCFKNGSLARERMRDQCAEGSWDIFNQLLNNTPRGNFGNLGLYYYDHEILPPLEGEFRFNKVAQVTKFNSLEVEVRACVEGQCIAKRAYTEDSGFIIKKSTKILATGGASTNKAILQVLADVYNCPVYSQEFKNSAVLGSAYQAKFALLGGDVDIKALTSKLHPPELICTPYSDAAEIYDPMVSRFRLLIQVLQN